VVILGIGLGLRAIMSEFVASSILCKALLSVAAISPVGIILGFFFPGGIRIVRELRTEETPWYWALNGIAGVLCSALAVFNSIFGSISLNFYLSALCYAGTLLCLWRLTNLAKTKGRESPRDLPATTASRLIWRSSADSSSS